MFRDDRPARKDDDAGLGFRSTNTGRGTQGADSSRGGGDSSRGGGDSSRGGGDRGRGTRGGAQ